MLVELLFFGLIRASSSGAIRAAECAYVFEGDVIDLTAGEVQFFSALEFLVENSIALVALALYDARRNRHSRHVLRFVRLCKPSPTAKKATIAVSLQTIFASPS